MTPVISLHLFQASRTLFLQSVVEPPSASNIDPRYLKAVTFLISSSPSLTLLSWHEDGGRYSVLLLLTHIIYIYIHYIYIVVYTYTLKEGVEVFGNNRN